MRPDLQMLRGWHPTQAWGQPRPTGSADIRKVLPVLSAAPGARWLGARTEPGSVLCAVPAPPLPCHHGLTHAVYLSPSEEGACRAGSSGR